MRYLYLVFALLLFSGCAGSGLITGEPMTAVFETSKGTIKIELNEQAAPVTVANFKQYIQEGHYDGLIFHRIIPNFMIQGGGFTPEGEQAPTREPIVLESDNGLRNTRGTIAMARTMVPNSATSQFFINHVDNANLDYSPRSPGYAVFGTVVEGMNVVDEIAQVPTTTRQGMADWPVEPVVINRAYLE